MKNKIEEPCSVRIKKALALRNMRQSELCEKAKISKSSLSEYLRGAYEPKQDRLFVLADALDVDPVWLMGFDVPMERKKISPEKQVLTGGEEMLLELFRAIPKERQELVLQMIRVALGQSER